LTKGMNQVKLSVLYNLSYCKKSNHRSFQFYLLYRYFN